MVDFLRLVVCYILIILQWFYSAASAIALHEYNNWIAPPSPTLPRDTYASAVGYDSINNTIWILGSRASCCRRQLISYNIDSNSFKDYSALGLSNTVYGVGDFYTQIDDILYMITHTRLSTFNVNTAQYTYHYKDIPKYISD
eukprot:125215_1